MDKETLKNYILSLADKESSKPRLGTDGKFHIFYMVENQVNGRIYLGKHSCRKLHDDYMGSGSIITRAIKLHGIQNFIRYNIKFFDSSIDAYEFEKQIITEELLKNYCEILYNVKTGGIGNSAYDHHKIYNSMTEETKRIRSEKISQQNRWRTEEENRAYAIARAKAYYKNRDLGMSAEEKEKEYEDKIQHWNNKLKEYIDRGANRGTLNALKINKKPIKCHLCGCTYIQDQIKIHIKIYHNQAGVLPLS